MKIINKHIYADIVEKNVETEYAFNSDLHYYTVLTYKVNIITEYNINLFGKIFHKSKTKELPFLFKTLEMAKDFCEINPMYKPIYFLNKDKIWDATVKFITYKLYVDKKIIGYIWWQDKSVIINSMKNTMKFEPCKTPIVEGFVKNIKVSNWIETIYLSDIQYCGFTNKLSELAKPIINTSDTEKHWRFELIENK